MTGGRVLSIQALRFVAAALVLHMHALQLARAITGANGILGAGHLDQIGAVGVDIFFVLSGLVITLTGPLATPRPAGAVFFWRRWRRVAPIFYLLSLIPITMAAGHLNTDRLAATFLFWPAAGQGIVQPYIPAGWTLAFEMLFYSAVSLTLIGGRLGRNLAIAAVVVVALIVMRRLSDWNGLRLLANAIFLEFCLGAALALLPPRLRALSPRVGLGLIAAGFAVIASEAVFGMGDAFAWQPTLLDTNAAWRVLVFGLPATALVAGVLILDRQLAGRAPVKILAKLGDASYAIYLVHGLVILGLFHLWRWSRLTPRPALVVVSTLGAAIAVGWAVHLWIERPLLRGLRQWRLPDSPVPPGSRRSSATARGTP